MKIYSEPHVIPAHWIAGYDDGYAAAKAGNADDWHDPDDFVTDIMLGRSLSYDDAETYVNGYDNGVAKATIDAE